MDSPSGGRGMNWVCFEVQYCIDCNTQVIESLGVQYCNCGDDEE
jgi:hypothetical protein